LKEFLIWLNVTLESEELFFSALITFLNTPGPDIIGHIKGHSYKTRAFSWQRNDLCFGKVVRKNCIYGVKDLLKVLESKRIVA
jgi:hypothetical protein